MLNRVTVLTNCKSPTTQAYTAQTNEKVYISVLTAGAMQTILKVRLFLINLMMLPHVNYPKEEHDHALCMPLQSKTKKGKR